MQAKSILFGFGLGMVFLALIFLSVYRLGGHGLTEGALLEQAAHLGMVWPTDEIPEIVRRALEMGMVFEHGEGVEAVESSPAPPEPPVLPESPAETAPPTGELEPAEPPESSELAETPEPEPEPGFELDSEPEPETVWVHIPYSTSATAAAEELYALGVVSNAELFTAYLIAHGRTLVVQTGAVELPLGGSFEDVMRLITE